MNLPMGTIIHLLVFTNEECATHVVPLERIVGIKCDYPVKAKQVSVTGQKAPKEKYAMLNIFLSSGNRLTICLNGKAVLRILDDELSILETTSLKEFEETMIEMLQGAASRMPTHPKDTPLVVPPH